MPLTRYEARAMEAHDATMEARTLYFDFAKTQPV